MRKGAAPVATSVLQVLYRIQTVARVFSALQEVSPLQTLSIARSVMPGDMKSETNFALLVLPVPSRLPMKGTAPGAQLVALLNLP